ncbi:hypothetical protein, partial [Paenibacillus xylanexedens]|uniref:hypothetical protein n=2 Tax=Paenibacillus TaxID=44249 RepID=UPI001C8ED643
MKKVNRWVKLSVLSGTLVAGLLGASQATYADSYSNNSSGNLDLNAGLRLELGSLLSGHRDTGHENYGSYGGSSSATGALNLDLGLNAGLSSESMNRYNDRSSDHTVERSNSGKLGLGLNANVLGEGTTMSDYSRGGDDRNVNSSYESESRGALGLGLNVNAEGESATMAQSERTNSVKDGERNTNSSYVSESRGALDLGLNVNAEGESATMAQSERTNSVNDRERTVNSNYANESRG